MTILSARDGYPLWASRYGAETVVSALEDRVVAAAGVRTIGRALLDVGCGTGRRLLGSGASPAIGVDLSIEMLRSAERALGCAVADAQSLPFADASFDVVWCRLVVGHLRDIATVYSEFARVCRGNGSVIISDISAEAIAAGHRRTFRDSDGMVRELEHFVHVGDRQCAAAAVAGLRLSATHDGVIDETSRQQYADANRMADYEAQRGLALVRVWAFRKLDPESRSLITDRDV